MVNDDGATTALRCAPVLRSTTPVAWAADLLEAELAATVTTVREITLCLDPELPAEAFRISRPSPTSIELVGGDAAGAPYALTELADRLRTATATHTATPTDVLAAVTPLEAAPATPVRAVLRAFSSDALDLDWYRDERFWAEYLDFLAVNRVNRVHLAFGMPYNFSHDPGVYDNYLGFAYPFLVDVPGWNVRVAGVDAAERDANLAALRFASDEAARRGIHFQLGLWNHAVRPELDDNPNLRYPISGLPDEDIAGYSARAVRSLLNACPGIAGITFRLHYEGGVHEATRTQFWITVFDGVRGAARPVELDLHAKGVDRPLLDAAHAASPRVTLSPKFWAEHQGLPYHQGRVRDLEAARAADSDDLAGITRNTRRFTRYGYADFLECERRTDILFRMWPGTQRFLHWADPDLFAGYGRAATFAGARGMELCEPLTFRGRKNSGTGPRDLYVDDELHRSSSDDWKKYRLTYRLWGRLLYEPDAHPHQWRPFLRGLVGDSAEPLERGLAAASRILPLFTVAEGISASCNFYWPEVLTPLPLLADESNPYAFDTPAPHDWESASPFDPEYFATTAEYVDALVDGASLAKISPLRVAARLAELASTALDRVAAASLRGPEGRGLAIDTTIQAHLGQMLAHRLRAGIRFALFQRRQDARELRAALDELTRSRDALRRVVAVADAVYFRDLAFGDRPTERGHWRDRIMQLDDELDAVRALLPADVPDGEPIALIETPRREGDPELSSTWSADGEHVLSVEDGSAREVVFHARPVNQGATWTTRAVTPHAGRASWHVPPEIAARRYSLQWYVTVTGADGAATHHPGLGDDLDRCPYLVVPCHHVHTPSSPAHYREER